MKHFIPSLLLCSIMMGCSRKPQPGANEPSTLCNPVDISYRFGVEEPSRREAADPSIVWFKDRYYLFASKSSGYWHSFDLKEWSFVETNQLPSEDYAPTAIALGDTLFFLASSNEQSTIYKSAQPLEGTWQVAVEKLQQPVYDPAFFKDDDNRLYLYWGCSDKNPIYGVEIDYKSQFAFIGQPQALIYANPAMYGWEVPGDNNTLVDRHPWIEGAWMTKHNNRYYLQYAGPGTESRSYADAVYVSDQPMGPFTLQPHNPFVAKPKGFATGAGHGSTFADHYGNLWHMGTITISQKQIFERRLALHPVFIDEDGTLYANTKFGDYPMILPNKKINSFEEIFPGWMLLSLNKKVEVSSAVDTLPATNMTDEDIRTYWAAQSGSNHEYAILDLDGTYDVYLVQINFAEHLTQIFGRQKGLCHQYTIESSVDGKNWNLLIDKSNNQADCTHDYTQLPQKVACRFLKINNIKVPGGHFAISGFRVFGKGNGKAPAKVENLQATRNPLDRRSVTLRWNRSQQATGYNISFGMDANKLYSSLMVYNDTTVTINSLNANPNYYFTIEAFNENGITPNNSIVTIE